MGIPVTVLLDPVPVVFIPSDLVSVHVPDEGSPLRTILPVAKLQVGCVIVPIVGADTDGELIVTLADGAEAQCEVFETTHLYDPDKSPDIVVLAPVPVVTIPSVLVNVHVPVEGKPLNTTLPVGTEQEG